MDICTRDKLISIIQDECTRVKDLAGCNPGPVGLAVTDNWAARINDVAMALNTLRDMLMHVRTAGEAEVKKQNELRMMRNVYNREVLGSDKVEISG